MGKKNKVPVLINRKMLVSKTKTLVTYNRVYINEI
jgi:hypothetical protein